MGVTVLKACTKDENTFEGPESECPDGTWIGSIRGYSDALMVKEGNIVHVVAGRSTGKPVTAFQGSNLTVVPLPQTDKIRGARRVNITISYEYV